MTDNHPKVSDNRPIGVFDSGLGGLTVVKELTKILPNEDIIYLGDTARVPYGTRSKETIVKFSFEDANFLIGKKVKCIVIACNTASSMVGDALKRKLKIPVFDVIGPALSEAKRVSKGKIGTIGTRATIGSGAYKGTIGVACPLLVPFIEEGETESDALKLVVRDYLKSFEGKDIDTLILGCTHYPIIGNIIQEEIGKNIKLINPEKTVSAETKKFLSQNNMLSSQKVAGKRQYFVTDMTERFKKVAEMFLGHSLDGILEKTLVG
jgi:glutamate racemase